MSANANQTTSHAQGEQDMTEKAQTHKEMNPDEQIRRIEAGLCPICGIPRRPKSVFCSAACKANGYAQAVAAGWSPLKANGQEEN
jgi:hypothetical protein